MILAFGDSLTYGTGAAPNEAYPAKLVGADRQRVVVNAGVPGRNHRGGLATPARAAGRTSTQVGVAVPGRQRHVAASMPASRNRKQSPLDAADAARQQGANGADRRARTPIFGGAPDFYEELADEFQLPYDGDTLNTVLKDDALKSDPIHPNAAGYEAIAQGLARSC